MTKKITLNARTRKSEEKNPKEIRNAGSVPAIVYGQGVKNVQIVLNHVEMEKVFEKAGESSLIDLQVDEKQSHKVIIKDIDFDGLKHKIVHVDFYQVNMKNPIEVEIPFVFTGESKAEKESGAMIIHNAESVNVRCLPGDLLENMEIDLSKLEKIGDMIRMSDLKFPESFEVLSSLDEVIVIANEQEVQVEEPKPEAVAEVPVADAKEKPAEKAAPTKK